MRCIERQQTTRQDILQQALRRPNVIIQKKRPRPTVPTLVKTSVKKGYHIRFIFRTDAEWAEAKRMAEEQIARTNNAIQELQNELKRMHGGVVDSDHVSSNLENNPPRVDWKQYSLDPEHIAAEIMEVDDDESNTCSSSSED